MSRKMIVVLAGAVGTLLLGVGLLVSQEAPTTPPAPPEPPQPPAFAWTDGTILTDGGAWLGVRLKDVTAEKARELRLPGEFGAVVVHVESDSPGAKAGLMKDDVILEFAGDRVWSASQLQRLVRETPSGRTVAMKVSRAGQVRTLSVKLEGGSAHANSLFFHMPEIHLPEWEGNFFPSRGPSLGVSGEELTRQLADYFGVKQGKGVLVREVVVGSAAEKAGLKAGDVIVRVEGTEVGTVGELRRALPRDLEESKKVSLTIVRERHEQTLAVELEATGHRPLRRAEAVEFPDVDLRDMKEHAAELQRWAAEYQKEAQEYNHQWQEETRRMQKEIQREMKQAEEERQRANKELERELRHSAQDESDAVI